MPTQYKFCRVCRQNHDQGKSHRFSTKHKQRLDTLLKKIQKNVQEVRFFLKNVMRLKADIGSGNKFWCHFCEEEICENKGGLACEQTIHHLASKQHVEAVKRFWFENGGDAAKRQAFYISDSDFGKWEEACKALPPQDAPESNGKETNNIHTERCLADATSADNVSQSSVVCGSSLAVKPLSVLTDQSYLRCRHASGKVQVAAAISAQPCGTYLNGGIGSESRLLSAQDSVSNLPETQYGEKTSNGTLENRQSNGEVSVSVRQTERALGQNLTAIRPPPLSPGEGNVHSGALPPWLKSNIGQGSELQARVAHSPGSSLYMSRTQERKLAKLRNPNRVGAAWAEQRRAEMERERRGEVVKKSIPDSSAWLPSFGRVWQSGSRRESRKEFEAEKRSDRRKKTSGQNKRPLDLTLDAPKIRPYVSKRSRTMEGPGGTEEE